MPQPCSCTNPVQKTYKSKFCCVSTTSFYSFVLFFTPIFPHTFFLISTDIIADWGVFVKSIVHFSKGVPAFNEFPNPSLNRKIKFSSAQAESIMKKVFDFQNNYLDDEEIFSPKVAISSGGGSAAVWKLFKVPSKENVSKVLLKLQKLYLTLNIWGPNQALNEFTTKLQCLLLVPHHSLLKWKYSGIQNEYFISVSHLAHHRCQT